jgi:CBS domain-containing protein
VNLAELLAPDRIVFDVPGATVREAARPLVEAIVAAGRTTAPDTLEAMLAESLPREAVTVGQQAFLLHFRTDAVRELTVALGVTVEPVHREHDAGKEARIVALITAPAREASLFLRAVGAFARVLAREEVANAVETARTAAEILGLEALRTTELPDELLVRDVLPSGRTAVRPETTLGEAANLMVTSRVPALPVVSDKDEVLGMVGYRELLVHLLPRYTKRLSGEFAGRQRKSVQGNDPALTPVRDVMDRSVLCISEDQPLSEAAALLVNKNLERVPVVREGALIGLLTREDIVRRLFGP